MLRLDKWDKADAALRKTLGLSSDHVTRVYLHLSRIFIGVALEMGELCFDAYTTQFASIIILVGRLVDSEDALDAADPGPPVPLLLRDGPDAPLVLHRHEMPASRTTAQSN